MTRTCAPCNNRLGRNVEADLADWYDGVLTLPRFSGQAAVGHRRSRRILHRTTANDEFVFLIDGTVDPAVAQLLESGQVDMTATLPDRNRYHLALLKHAYLASCLEYGVPIGPEADAVRTELIAARDSPDRRSVPTSPLALGLTVLRLEGGASKITTPVALAVAHDQAERIVGALLGGWVFVSWCSVVGNPPAQDEPGPKLVRAALSVSAKVDGTVTAAQ
jgi:hypothetical protein